MEDKLFSIGETAKLSHIPIKTLRYYDEIDLLKPVYVNNETHYRYYSQEQFFTISIIKELKLFNFSLKEIKEFLKREDLSKVAELYHHKKEKIKNKIQHLQKIEKRIENRFEAFSHCFEQIYNKDQSSGNYQVQLKMIAKRDIVFLRYQSAFNLNVFSLRCIKLHNLIEEHNLYIKSPFMSIFHDEYDRFDPNNADIETCGCIYKKNINKKLPFIRSLAPSLYASLICKGDHEQSVQAYHYLKNWIQKNSYKIIGPTIKFYIINAKLIKDEKNFASELQIPIEKI